MAWITSGRQSDGSWLCQQCTFHNKAGQKRCSMCDSREPPTSNKRRMKGSLSSRVDIAEGKESISRGKALEMLKDGPKRGALTLGDLTGLGTRSVLDDDLEDGGYFVHKTSGEWTPLKERNGLYTLKMWVPRQQSTPF